MESETSSRIYSESFYDETTAGSLTAARKILGLISALAPVGSIVDVGCGVGTWLLAARELGATRLQGFDGPYVPRHKLLIESERVDFVNLDDPLPRRDEFDLCTCLEVAEHLSPRRADSLVADLASYSHIVAFSAAIPFQGGDGHSNEMWPEYWAGRFHDLDYLPWLGLRDAIWHIREIPWWYRQNLILFVRRSEWRNVLKEQEPANLRQLTAIHPESYLWNIRRRTRALPTSYSFDVDAYYSAVSGDMTQAPGYGPEFPAPRPGSEET